MQSKPERKIINVNYEEMYEEGLLLVSAHIVLPN